MKNVHTKKNKKNKEYDKVIIWDPIFTLFFSRGIH